jgi:hypothetical protein
MTALALPTVRDVPAGTSVRPLALIEAKRFARHPLFLVGAVMCAIFSYGHHGPEELDYHVIPSFFIGVLGLVVGARLTASTSRSAPVVDSVPKSETARTAAMCLACLVPTLTGLAIVLMHRATIAANPIPGYLYGTYGSFDRFVMTVVVPVIACAGGPLLGVAVGRWLRFPGAALLSVLVVLIWSNIAAYVPGESSRFGHVDGSTLFARTLHMVTPYTAFGSGDGDGAHATRVMTSYTGSPGWYAVWTVALCGLAVCAALWRGAAGEVRRLVGRAFVVLVVIALVSLVLAVVNGNQRAYTTTRSGTSPVTAASHSGG